MKRKSLATMTAVYPPARYGAVEIAHGSVVNFSEKSSTKHAYINGGFFVLNKEIFRLLDKYTNPSWEVDILPKLSNQNKLSAFEHNGFWFAMDTLRDKEYLEDLLRDGAATWLHNSNLDNH
jgi:glucose-1-phosphate cytidylyltransferase